MDLFITRTLYDAVTKGPLDPRWASDPDQEMKRRLLVWILRESKRDVRGVVTGIRAARFLKGYHPDVPRNDVSIRGLLVRLKAGLPPSSFNIDHYRFAGSRRYRTHKGRGNATTISSVRLPVSVWRASRYEREYGAVDPLVHALTGRPHHPSKDRLVQRIADEDAARRRRASDTPTETAELIEYLHGRSGRTFSERVDREMPGMVDDALRVKDTDVRAATLRALRGLRIQPAPIYTTSTRTQRLVASGMGLGNAPTRVRRLVLQDCYEVDMASAHLALVASIWNVPSVRAFLASGTSFWDDVAQHLSAAFPNGGYVPAKHFDRLKGLLKVATYGIVYGMLEKNVARWRSPSLLGPKDKKERTRDRAFIRRAFGTKPDDVGAEFMNHPLVSDLLQARAARLTSVEQAGSLTDVFGRKYTLDTTVRKRVTTARSALACETQAVEHYLMLRAARPFIDESDRVAAKRTGGAKKALPEAEILLWQSDGFSFRVRQRDRAQRWLDAAEQGLQTGCHDLHVMLGGQPIVTRLETKHRPLG